MIRLSTLYHFGYNREYVDVKINSSPVGPYLTDPSFYVPTSEESKVQSTYDCFNGAYDDYQVPTALVDLRRPGNDISECNELYNTLKDDFDSKISVTNTELSEKAKKELESKNVSNERSTFIDNLMQNSSSNSQSNLTS